MNFPLNLISGEAARWKLSQISCMHLNDLWLNNQNKTNFILKLFLIAKTFGTKSLCFLFLNLYYKSIYWTLDYIWLFVFRVDMWPLKSENKPNKQFYAVILQLQYVQCRMNICVEASNSSHKSYRVSQKKLSFAKLSICRSGKWLGRNTYDFGWQIQ